MNLLIGLAIFAIFFMKTTRVYSSFPTDINNNYFDVRNSTLPRTTSHPHTYRPRYYLPPREYYNEDEKPYVIGEYSEDREIPRFSHKRVAREPATQQGFPYGRRLNGNLLGQADDNRLDSETADDGNDDYPSDQPPVALAAQREVQYGTPNAIEEARARKVNNARIKELTKRAENHQKFMSENGACRWPRPEVVYIPTATDAFYSPRATILHRCSEKIGCCAAKSSCQMKTNQIVEKVFFKIKGSHREPIFFNMVNHTECECVKVETRRKRSPLCQCPKHFIDFSWTESPTVEEEEEEEEQEVYPWELKEQRCRCDCHLSDDTCKRLKNGLEGFSVMERRRIQSGEISPPFCNYGPYDAKNGRCPRPEFPNRTLSRHNYIQSRRQHNKS
ncbi:uncharacterized protein Pvf2 [Drosophila takahashii]|uniref:uncharacterized protein Pvf2 n=1 Tax=Drosophila takahashii TaxID=29030 RepID=UPI001CF81C2B|nr:uncharacterized protein LOC108062471 [Drosophila takahashii]